MPPPPSRIQKKTICIGTFNLDLLLIDIRRWQAYVEPGDEPDTGSPSKRISRNMEQSFSERLAGPSEEPLLPLPEDTLTRNLGLDLIVVATKVRYLNSKAKDVTNVRFLNKNSFCYNSHSSPPRLAN